MNKKDLRWVIESRPRGSKGRWTPFGYCRTKKQAEAPRGLNTAAREQAFRESKEDCRASHTVETQRVNALTSELSGAREWATGQAEKIAELTLERDAIKDGPYFDEVRAALVRAARAEEAVEALKTEYRMATDAAHFEWERAEKAEDERDALKALAGTLVDALEVAKEALESLVVPSALTHSTLAVHVFQVAEEGGRKVSAALSEARGLLPKEEGK